jgi:hypothetical protein
MFPGEIAKIAAIAKVTNWKNNPLPLMNADNTDQRKSCLGSSPLPPLVGLPCSSATGGIDPRSASLISVIRVHPW